MSGMIVKQQNRQEFLFYLLGGTLLLFMLSLSALVVWYARPIIPPTKVVIGNISDFPPSDSPYIPQQHYQLVVTHVGGQLYVLDRTLPLDGFQSPGRRCELLWRADLGVFDDPCWGLARFGLDGSIVQAFLPDTRPMSRYAYEIDKNGRIIIDLNEINRGEVAGEQIGVD